MTAEFRAALIAVATGANSTRVIVEAFDAAAAVTGDKNLRAAAANLLNLGGRPAIDDEFALKKIERLIARGESTWGACLMVATSMPGKPEVVAHRLSRKRRAWTKLVLSK